MSAEMAQKLVQGGIKAVRDGKPDLARKAFTQALKLDPQSEVAWLGMATITEDPDDKRRILERVLSINPDNERAATALAQLSPDEPEPEFITGSDPIRETNAFSAAIDDIDEAKLADTGELSLDIEDPPLPEAEEEFDDEGIPLPPMFDMDDTEEEFDDEGIPLPPMFGTDDAEDDDVIEDLRLPDDDFMIEGVEIDATDALEMTPVVSPGDTGELSDFPEPDLEIEEDEPYEIRSSAEVFAQLPGAPQVGDAGIPRVNPQRANELSQEVYDEVQAYLEDMLADYLTPDTPWEVKTRGRAGSGEYRTYLTQVGAAAFVAIMIVTAGLVGFVASNAQAQYILLGASPTPSPTPTNTPTATPGVTNTPSQTPNPPATASATLEARATLGFNDPNFPPDPTEPYYPVEAPPDIDVALALMENGNLDEARDILDDAVAIERDSGGFPPFYRLSQWHLFNDDPETARQILTDWEDTFQEADPGLYDRSQPLLLIAYARVDIYEVENGIGDRATLISNAQERLELSLGIEQGISPDRVNPEGYALLARSYALQNDIDGALEVIDLAFEQEFEDQILYNNTALRMQRVQILVQDGQIGEAFQELNDVLLLDPFLEEALIYQTELALDNDQPGLGVLYAQQYLLYYPGSLQGFYLLGQAREAESKFDLALNAYSRAVAGDTDVESYVNDPFFLENLLARAELYVQQGNLDASAADYTLALELTDNDPQIRVRRLQGAFAAGNYEDVLLDAEELLSDEEADVDTSLIQYYQGLALVAQARASEEGEFDSNYGDAVDPLEGALASGLSAEFVPNAQETLALAYFEERQLTNALDTINIALESAVTGSRVYLRGQILEAQSRLSDALLDYEYVVTWSAFYDYPFADEAQAAYDGVLASLGRR
ncbi:MAG: hypothetical protein AAFR81_13875 [Chloroflexota bacterium]